MGAIAYSVFATLPDERTREEYIAWLRAGHLNEVIRGGAQSATIMKVTEPAVPVCVETRYLFSSRDAFDRYVADHAPALRADGLKRFGPERGVKFERKIGELL
jgi:hypothetical protein